MFEDTGAGDTNGSFRFLVKIFYGTIKDRELPMYDTNGRNSVMENSLSTLTVAEFLKRVKDRNGRLYVSEDVSLNYMLNYSIHKIHLSRHLY